jgi:GNAT superfamily N-acetyltransferase
MMPDFVVRGYRGGDETGLLALWNAALPWDPVDVSTFRRQVLLDPNFHADWLLVAAAGDQLVGFCLCLIRRVALEGLGLEPERGWITALGVLPERRRQGLGRALLVAAGRLMRDAGRESVAIAPYAPNYFVPGVDVERHAEGVAFLRAQGFETAAEAISMDANIVLLDTSWTAEREARLAGQGIVVRSLRPADLPALLAFLRDHMYGDWLRHGRDLLVDATRGLASLDQFTVALRDNEVLGYCQFEGEHFGPFGVRSDVQGLGIGTVVLAKCLDTMRAHGHHHAWVLWTSDETADKVYGRFGFKPTRRFAIMRQQL